MNIQQSINQVCSHIEDVIVNLNGVVDRVNSLTTKLNSFYKEFEASKTIFDENLKIVMALQERITALENASKDS